VTANELLVLLGRAWSRLLIFPGGLAAFGLAWLIGVLLQRIWNPESQLVKAAGDSRTLTLSSIVLPWLGLALLPLPLAVALPRQVDIVVVLALLEWPNLLAIRQELRLGDRRRLAAALNSYPPLILATLALAQASNSLEIAALARPPADAATIEVRVLHWLGAIALALALPPALRIGPFAGKVAQQAGKVVGEVGLAPREAGNAPEQAHHAPEQAGNVPQQAHHAGEQAGNVPQQAHHAPEQAGNLPREAGKVLVQARTVAEQRGKVLMQGRQAAMHGQAFPQFSIPNPQSSIFRLGLRLRAVGLVALAGLPWAGAEGTALSLLRLLGAAALIVALLRAYDRLARRQAARGWARAYLALDVVLLVALLAAAYLALQIRLA
jgi:hypothetical protein